MRQTTLLAGVIAIIAGLFAAPSPGQTAPIAAGWGTENAGESDAPTSDAPASGASVLAACSSVLKSKSSLMILITLKPLCC